MIHPIGERALIRMSGAGEETTSSGIILNTKKEYHDRGVIEALGDEKEADAVGIAVGQTVIFSGGEEVDEKLVMVDYSSVMAVIVE